MDLHHRAPHGWPGLARDLTRAEAPPAERFHALVPVLNGPARSLLMAAVVIAFHTAGRVCAKAIAGWAYLPFGALVILLSWGCGKAFGTFWWPVLLIVGFWVTTAGMAHVDHLGPIALHVITDPWNWMILLMFFAAFFGALAASERSGNLQRA